MRRAKSMSSIRSMPSLGQGLLVVFAAECAHAGLSVEKTIAAVHELIPQTQTYGMLRDLSYAVRGGRVPAWVQTAARFMHVTPFIRATPDGKIAPAGCVFGRRDNVRKFARTLARRAPRKGPLNVAVGHAMCADDAERARRVAAKGPATDRAPHND